jgi:hypothetical protein
MKSGITSGTFLEFMRLHADHLGQFGKVLLFAPNPLSIFTLNQGHHKDLKNSLQNSSH